MFPVTASLHSFSHRVLTYSEKTLRLLSARIAELEAAGVSYAELIIENGLKRRGFRGLDDAEKFLEARR